MSGPPSRRCRISHGFGQHKDAGLEPLFFYGDPEAYMSLFWTNHPTYGQTSYQNRGQMSL